MGTLGEKTYDLILSWTEQIGSDEICFTFRGDLLTFIFCNNVSS